MEEVTGRGGSGGGWFEDTIPAGVLSPYWPPNTRGSFRIGFRKLVLGCIAAVAFDSDLVCFVCPAVSLFSLFYHKLSRSYLIKLCITHYIVEFT